MATLIEIESADDDRLRDYVALRETSLRHSLEAAEGIFIAEGPLVIRRAIEAGYRPRSLLLAARYVDELGDLLGELDVPVYVVSVRMAERITGFHVHRGALASVERRRRHTMDDLLGASRLVVVEDIVDHTNVGAILRAAAGLGWDGVLLAPGAADPLYRRSVKTSMGAVFSLPWARLTSHDLTPLKRAGITLVAMALREGAVTLDEYAASLQGHERIALLMGTEGAGLSDEWLAAADVVVTIPMGHGIDSLNVASATAVACYTLRPR